jgi:hypothetical protein
MPHTPEELLVLADHFEKLCKIAKDKPKLDPKAKVRNRGTVCVPASSAKDKKDHFPINNEAQARNALARVHQYSKAPPWYSGSLKSLQELVSRKVHSKYKGIGKDKKKKSSLEVNATLLIKYAQQPGNPNFVGPTQPQQTLDSTKFPPALVKDVQQSLNALKYGPLQIDGKMGTETVNALQKFWKSKGIDWNINSTAPFNSIVDSVKSWVGVDLNKPAQLPHNRKH